MIIRVICIVISGLVSAEALAQAPSTGPYVEAGGPAHVAPAAAA